MRRPFTKSIIIILAFVYHGCNQPIFALNLCELDMNIQFLNGQRLRISAFMRENFENAFLYDPTCQDGKPLIHFELKPEVNGKIEKLKKIMRKNGHAFVTVEGIVHGPEPVQVAPKLADKIKEIYNGVIPMRTYGHFNAYKMEIEIDNIIEATEKNIKTQSSGD